MFISIYTYIYINPGTNYRICLQMQKDGQPAMYAKKALKVTGFHNLKPRSIRESAHRKGIWLYGRA